MVNMEWTMSYHDNDRVLTTFSRKIFHSNVAFTVSVLRGFTKGDVHIFTPFMHGESASASTSTSAIAMDEFEFFLVHLSGKRERFELPPQHHECVLYCEDYDELLYWQRKIKERYIGVQEVRAPDSFHCSLGLTWIAITCHEDGRVQQIREKSGRVSDLEQDFATAVETSSRYKEAVIERQRENDIELREEEMAMKKDDTRIAVFHFDE